MSPVLGQLFRDTINFIFPPTCIVSENRLPENNSNRYVSDEIFSSLEKISPSDLVELKQKVNADEVFGYYTLRPGSYMERIVHHIKYSGMKNLGTFMGESLGEILKNDLTNCDYIIPVPLHKIRIRERNYNQSDYIAKGLSNKLEIISFPGSVSRVRYTKSQTRLTRPERIENVKGAFDINEKFRDELRGKNLIVVDDIVTTGSTINEVIKVLKENGAGNILAVCLAMARD